MVGRWTYLDSSALRSFHAYMVLCTTTASAYFSTALAAEISPGKVMNILLIQRVRKSNNEKQELAADFKAVVENTNPAVALVDTGFVSEADIEKIKTENPGLQVLIGRKASPAGAQSNTSKSTPTPRHQFGHRLRHQDETPHIHRRQPHALLTAPANGRTHLRNHQGSDKIQGASSRLKQEIIRPFARKQFPKHRTTTGR